MTTTSTDLGDTSGTPTTSPLPLAGRREWIGLAVLALPCVLITMDLTVLFLAVPSLVAAMRPDALELLWITDVYGFLLAGALIAMGNLGDRLGRRRLIMYGAAAFGAASVLAALATSPETLIGARGMQGIAAAAILPSTMALAFTMFQDAKQRTAALGVLMASFALGGVLGPLLGGAVLEVFDWSAIFLLNLPVMALLLAVAPRLLPEARDPRPGRVDLTSVALSVISVIATIYGIKEIAHYGWSATAVAAAGSGVALGIAFVRRQLKVNDPLVDVRLFTHRTFSTVFAAAVVSMFATYGMVFFTAQQFQLVLGLSPLQAGLCGLPPAMTMMVAAGVVVPRLSGRLRPAFLIAGGLVVAAVGLLLLTRVGPDSGIFAVVGPMVLAVGGLAPAMTLGMTMIVGLAPPERAGSVSGLSDAGNELAGALGIAILGSIGSAVYRTQMDGAGPPAAQETLGGAREVINRGAASPELLDTATQAFTQGMHLATGTGATVLLVVALATAVLLRNVTHADLANGSTELSESNSDAQPELGSPVSSAGGSS